jgi:hypothetical protein
MSIWSWFTGTAEKPSGHSPALPEDKEYYELVFLMKQAPHVGLEYVWGAVDHAFGVKLPVSEPDDSDDSDETDDSDDSRHEDFLTGQWPIFMFQLQGRLFQLKFLPISYFDADALPLVPGDREAIGQKVADKELKRAIKKHQGLISVWLMNPNCPPGSLEPYADVGKMLASAAANDPDTYAIVWPARNEIRLWEDDEEEWAAMESGRALDLFSLQE